MPVDPFDERQHVNSGVGFADLVQHLAGDDVERSKQVDITDEPLGESCVQCGLRDTSLTAMRRRWLRLRPPHAGHRSWFVFRVGTFDVASRLAVGRLIHASNYTRVFRVKHTR